MSAYFISPFKPPIWTRETELRINPAEYSQELQQLWPDVRIRSNYSEYYVLWWELKKDNAFPIMGGLQNDYRVISIEGSGEYIADFALFHRAYISAKYSLYFFHESLETEFELVSGLTKDEIISMIG